MRLSRLTSGAFTLILVAGVVLGSWQGPTSAAEPGRTPPPRRNDRTPPDRRVDPPANQRQTPPDRRIQTPAQTNQQPQTGQQQGGKLLEPAHPHSVFDVAFSPDGKWLASASRDIVNVWDARTGQLHRTLEQSGGQIAFSPDGNRFASTGSKLRQWNPQTWEELPTPVMPSQWICALEYTQPMRLAGKRGATDRLGGAQLPAEPQVHLAAAFWEGMVRLYNMDVSTPEQAVVSQQYDFTEWNSPEDQFSVSFNDIAISPDGSLIATVGTTHRLILSDTVTAERKQSLILAHGQDVFFTPDGKYVGAMGEDWAGRFVGMWDVQSGQKYRDLLLTVPVSAVAVSPDGKTLAVAGYFVSYDEGFTYKGFILLVDIETWEFKTLLEGHTGPIHALAFSPDGYKLASGSMDKTVRLWTLGTPDNPLASTNIPDKVRKLEQRVPAAPRAFSIAFNPEIRGRMGRLIIAFPKGSKAANTHAELFAAANPKTSIKSGYGPQVIDLLPGSYNLTISNKQISDIPIESGSDTLVHLGVLHIRAGADTHFAVLDADQKTEVVTGYGEQQIGLVPGQYHVVIAGQSEQVTIEPGKVLDF